MDSSIAPSVSLTSQSSDGLNQAKSVAGAGALVFDAVTETHFAQLFTVSSRLAEFENGGPTPGFFRVFGQSGGPVLQVSEQTRRVLTTRPSMYEAKSGGTALNQDTTLATTACCAAAIDIPSSGACEITPAWDPGNPRFLTSSMPVDWETPGNKACFTCAALRTNSADAAGMVFATIKCRTGLP